MAGALTWVKSISSRVGSADTRLAVLETTQAQIPDLLREIKTEVHGLREDGNSRDKGLYDHVDKVRLELREEIRQKMDKN